MRLNRKFVERLDPANDRDPREGQGAEVIDLATRNTLPAVSQRKTRSDGLALAGGVAAVALLGALTFWSMDAARLPEPDARADQPAQTVVPPPAPAVVPPAAVASPAPAPLAAPPPQAVLAAAPQPVTATMPAGKPYASPTMVFDASTPAGQLVVPGAPGAPAGTGNSNDDFASRLGGMNGTKAVATASVNPRTTVTQGTLIPAVLETAIDTDVPGYVRAVVSTDVKSFDGTRVLVPRSSRLIGQYKSGLQAGQKRAYVIWTRLIRPDGVSVDIGSPAVSFSGETGLPGRVNSHFFERFGSAMLLSVVGGLSAIGGGSTAGVVVAGGGQSAAAAAVGQSGQIGPTVRVRQGEPIRVFTARDLDFSKVSR